MASQFGPYKLIRQVAVGGMAEIHLAKTAGIAGFEKYVAIKMIHPNFAEDEQFIQMLVDEAKIAVQLNHGNIAQTFDLGRVGETYYITMEYVDGADLYKILRRASEQDLEMPLDVCAFVGKEISSALDHAHRKRDHAGKSLGIVHRDVSPQNVLVSYAGEVKLVDFGIAKATMKVRQTAVGVIKGKYYYMSPEQAWGDPIDHRSDIFSAGIVLYEMITGQMLYLEEDLHKLLEMARAAEISPPSKLRRGVPPQLERIVMRSLAKQPGDRYQSAGDFATDLERFLHAYSPVFTASKLSNLMRQVVGEPMEVPDDDVPFEAIEFRDGVMSTHPLDDSEIAHAVDREELRDENSVIFRMSELDKRNTDTGSVAPNGAARPAATPPPRIPQAGAPPVGAPPVGSMDASPRGSARPTEPSKPASRGSQPAPKNTRTAELPSITGPRTGGSGPQAKIPSIAAPALPPKPTGGMKIPQITKPRQAHEETRQLEGPAPSNPLQEDSGLLVAPVPPPPDRQPLWTASLADDLGDDDLENIGERTLVTAAPGSSTGSGMLASFMMDVAGDDTDGPVEATLVTSVPGFGGAPALDDEGDAIDPDLADEVDDDMPTLSGREGIEAAREIARDLSRDAVANQQRAAQPAPAAPVRRPAKAPPPAALAAKIHAPAVSELRKPRASRRTPPGGSPVTSPNVLQAIVSSQGSAPMPSPRPQPQQAAQPTQPPVLPPAPPAPMPMPQPMAAPYYAQQPQGYAPYGTDASGLPLGAPMQGQMPGYPMQMQPGMPPGGYDPQTAVANQVNAYGYPQLSPQALYQFQPPAPQKPMSLTGQLRLSEVDEMPSQYKIGSAGRRWFTYAVSGLIAISVAAASTFLIIRATRDNPPTTGTIHIDSAPQNAVVTIDGSKMTQTTPVTIDEIPTGTRHTIRIEAAHYQPYEETIDIPKKGGEVTVIGRLETVLGKILVDSRPTGAEIWVNGQLKGHTSMTLNGFDPTSRVHVELRLKDYQPIVKDYDWPPDGKITISETLAKVK